MNGIVRFVDLRFEIKCRCFRCGDKKITGCRGQFLFRNEFVNDIFDNFLISLCGIFVYFCLLDTSSIIISIIIF